MKRSGNTLVALLLILTGCGEDGPTAADVSACVKAHENDARCPELRTIANVRKVDSEVQNNKASATAEVDFLIKSEMETSSILAEDCLAGTWLLTHDRNKNYIKPGKTMRVSMRIDFEKSESGWRCTTKELSGYKAAVN